MRRTAQQFGQQIGKFQGVSFKLADMAMELKAAELLTLEAAWKYDQGTVTDMDMAMAKLKATEMLAIVADEAIQIHGGMGLMEICRSSASGAMRASSASGKAPAKSSATSFPARCLQARRRVDGSAYRLERLLRPKSIAVIGGRFRPTNVVRQSLKMGFAGEIWPVHPTQGRGRGVKAYRSVADLPGAPDAAFIGVNRHLTIEMVRALARARRRRRGLLRLRLPRDRRLRRGWRAAAGANCSKRPATCRSSGRTATA